MTIEEAILDLASIPPWPNENDDPHYLDAVKLGIEALDRIIEARKYHGVDVDRLLPGETKD